MNNDAAALLARAFDTDPFIRWAEPDDQRRTRTMRPVFAGMLNFADKAGGHHFEPGIGSVHWRVGDRALMRTWDVVRSGLWKVGLSAPSAVWRRLSMHEDAAMQRVRRFLSPGSVYLCTLGIEPERAGQGHGGRLLQHVLKSFIGHWDTCVLRTEQPRNIPFYLRHGFVLQEEHVVQQSGLRIWVFSRPMGSQTTPPLPRAP
jgi:GNAT superfamily N-acetyltransferase